MTNLRLSLAVGDYEHVRDLVTGDVRAEGIDLCVSRMAIEELLFRFLRHKEWQVAEMGLGPYASLLSRGDTSMVGIPVFTSRTFRHSSIYLRAGSGVASPADLAGKRIGYPEWAMTAIVYARALLQHAYGVDLRSIEWVQAGVDEPGRIDKMKLDLPGFNIRAEPDRTLSGMLQAGELDAILSARPPRPFLQGDPAIVRAWPDAFAVEMDYWRASRIFPVMHLIVIRRDVYERDPWVAANLQTAFESAKQRALARLHDATVSHLPVPWFGHHAALARREFGDDIWPYGVEPNRVTLDAFCQYAFEQGVCARRLAVDELFAPSTLRSSRV